MASSDGPDPIADVGAIERMLDPELWVVTASDGPRRGGLIATFVNLASIAPELPRVLVGIARSHQTWALIEASGAFALHLVNERDLDWVERFGLRSGRVADKFAGLETQTGRSGSPILTAAPGWLDCRVEARFDTGDRTVFLGAVLDARARPTPAPVMTVHRLLSTASDALRARLIADRDRDAALDADAIRAWRRSSGSSPGPG